MPKTKTTIRIEETLFLQVKILAASLEVSRSRIFEMAMEKFLRRHEEAITLNNADRDNFVQPLNSEEEPNEALAQAAKDFNERYSA